MPVAWRERWAPEANRYGQAPLPMAFDDEVNAGLPVDAGQLGAESRSRQTIALVRELVVPRLLREARDRGWWDPMAPASLAGLDAAAPLGASDAGRPLGTNPRVIERVDAGSWSKVALAAQVIAPADPVVAHQLVLAAIGDGAIVSAAITGIVVVGLAIAGPAAQDGRRDLLAFGVAPAHRRAGLASRVLAVSSADRAELTVAERDPLEPLEVGVRSAFATHLLTRAGFDVRSASGAIGSADPTALVATRGG